MATARKSIEALQKDLAAMDKRIEGLEQQLRRYRENRKRLQAKISEAQAAELMGILAQRELSFEEARDILAAANSFYGKEAETP